MTFAQFWIGYATVAIEGLIALYACHQHPYGVRSCRWRDLWRQLCYRPPTLPRAIARSL